MQGLEAFSSVVSKIHASPMAPGCWDAALAELTPHLDATACTITVGTGSQRSILSSSIDGEAAAAYADYYHQLDFVMKSCESDPVGLVRGGWEIVSAHKRSEFYADWQHRFDMTDGLFVRLSASTPSSFVLSAPQRSDPYESAERVRFVNALVPHLQQALAARRGLLDTDQHQRPADISAAADVIRHGIIVVAAGGRIVQMNTAAQHLVPAGDGLWFSGERIRACSPSSDHELQEAVTKALVRQGVKPRIGSYLVCGRPSGKRPYVVRVMPLDACDDPAVARAAVVVIDPDQQFKPPKVLLRMLFNLTDAECEVALRMLCGDGAQVIADHTKVSVATIRTQIQSIFRKTGTNRQAELVRLLIAMVP